MRVARNAKSDLKGFFQIYKTKNTDRIGPIKKDNEIIENNEDMSEALNETSYQYSRKGRRKINEPQHNKLAGNPRNS